MDNREEFEQRANKAGLLDEAAREVARDGWNARQPEIDALKEEIALCHGTLESRERNIETLMKENAALKAEVERLRNALPLTPEAVIAFIGHNFDFIEPVDEEGKPQGRLDCVRFSLTVHDLLSAFSDLNAAMKETK